MRFLVTGGAGFIGSNIVERLLKDGHFVRVLDNFYSGKRENLNFVIASEATTKSSVIASEAKQSQNFELIEGDIRDKAACEKACTGMDYVLHQAALRSVPKSMKEPESYNEVNIGGILNMLQAASKAKVKRFVFASSSSVYGDTDKFPEEESAYPLLISPYALSKLAGEYYCRIFSEFFGVETACLRYFNVFGPRQALDDEYAVVIPKFIHCILHDKQPPIFGNGKQSRDFTYIDNVVQANILAATVPLIGEHSTPLREEHSSSSSSTPPSRGHFSSKLSESSLKKSVPSSKMAHLVVNVANGKDNTVLQLVDYLNKIIGKNIKPEFLPVRAGDVFRTCADISKIKAKLGYEPKVTFEEGLKRTVEYFKTKKN